MKKALVVVDWQNDYFGGGNVELVGAQEAVQQTNRLIKFVRRSEYKIYFVQHFSTNHSATFLCQIQKELN